MSRENLRTSEIERILIESDSSLDNVTLDENDSGDLFDDTDDDPTYDPFGPSTSTSNTNISTRLDVLDSDSEDDIGISNHPRPTAPKRPRLTDTVQRRVLSSSSSENDSDSEWEQIFENNPLDFQHNFSYSELPGPKHISENVSKTNRFLQFTIYRCSIQYYGD
jgi:hypothetical protein